MRYLQMAIDELRFSIRVCTYWIAIFAFFIHAGFIDISMLLNAIGWVAPLWSLMFLSVHLLFSYFCVFHKCGFYRHVHSCERHRLGCLRPIWYLRSLMLSEACTYCFAIFAFLINAGFIDISMLLNAIGRVAPPLSSDVLVRAPIIFLFLCFS